MMKIKFNKYKLKSLQWQLLARFFLILIALLLIMGFTQYITTKNYLASSKTGMLSAKFHDIDFNVLNKINTSEAVKQNSSYIINKLAGVGIGISVIDKNGHTIADSYKITNKSTAKLHPNQIGKGKKEEKKKHVAISIPKLSSSDYTQILNKYGNIERDYRLYEDSNDVLQIVMWRKIGPLDSPLGLIQLSTSVNDIEDILHHQVYIYVGVSLLILFIGAALCIAVLKQTLNPLSNMTETVEQINVKQLNTRLPENNGQLEIDKLSSSFNNMLERIETSFEKEQYIKQKMQQFVSDASHELRTPLTSIHGFVEVLLRGAAKNEKQLDLALNSIMLESERLAKLVNDLLTLTRLDQQVSTEMKVENINDVISEVFPQLIILSGKRIIELNLKDNIKANINKNQMKQVIYNLVQNSIRHTSENSGIITISTDIENNYVVLKIEDNGTGISKEHLNKIFDRFFRSEAHRSREHGGYGLGLSIVKSIIDAHKGKITVESELEVGTTFSIYLEAIK